MQRWLWLIAGPNGAGKSTRGQEILSGIEDIVRPDEIAMKLSPAGPERAAMRAGREAILRTRQLLAGRRSFAIETTLSGRRYIQIARAARRRGWKLGLIYIGLRSPELAIERVRERHSAGGHDVPVDDIRRRYERSLENIRVFQGLAHRALYFDNSSRSPIKLLEIANGSQIFSRRRLPAWLRGRVSIETAAARRRK